MSHCLLYVIEKILGNGCEFHMLLKVLSGAGDQATEETVKQFALEELHGIMRHIPDEKTQEIIERLQKKGFIQVKQIQFGAYYFPMLILEESGSRLLSSLMVTEDTRIPELAAQSESITAGLYRKGPDYLALDRFLRTSIKILNHCREHLEDAHIIEVLSDKVMEPMEDVKQCASFFQHHVLSGEASWYEPQAFQQVYDAFIANIRSFLGKIPEMQGAIFRLMYALRDAFYHDQDALISYYKVDNIAMQEAFVLALSKIFSVKQQRRNWLIEAIAKTAKEETFQNNEPGKDSSEDTYHVTYSLYLQGNSVDEIAQTRNLKKSTIYSHFFKLMPLYHIALNQVIVDDRIETIQSVARQYKTQENKVIKDALPGDYDYNEIRLVLAFSQNNLIPKRG